MHFLIAVSLDVTGSMASAKHQTIAGFNAFLHEQQASPEGKCSLSLDLFHSPAGNPVIEHRIPARPVAQVPDLGSAKNLYHPNGNTPLYDAVGLLIRETEKVADKYDKILCLIVTDGQENDSREWTRQQVFDLITEKLAAGWDFVFMGADQDAYADNAAHIAVAAANTFAFDSANASAAWSTTSGSTINYRSVAGASGGDFYGTGGAVDVRGSVPPATQVVTTTPAPVVACPSCKQPFGQHAADCTIILYRQ